ncbi:MAG: T9SS C-terminal target domain-containing protein [Calditrichaeota bacterium]|nr:MAG: T9SS C-terminal target domain-containing protein [Calditrichota bacterium]
MFKNSLMILLLSLLCGLVTIQAKENPKDAVSNVSLEKSSADKPTRTISNIGNWGYWIEYDGKSAHDPNGSSGGFYPRGTAASIYQDGIIWGGYVSGDPDTSHRALRVGGQTYAIGTTPGWINSDGTAEDPSSQRVRMYRIRTDWRSLSEKDADGNYINLEKLRQDAAEIFVTSAASVTEDQMLQVLNQYETDWNEWPVDLGAPFVDVDGDGSYDPDVDIAGLANADQVIWFVINDLNAGNVANLYGADPIGLEVQVTIWAYNQPNSTLGQILFKKYKLINKSSFQVDSMFVAQWSDPDVGTYTDDLAGCDIEKSIGFAYSGYRTDGDYSIFGLPPAAVGYDFFQGPLVKGVAGQDLNLNGVDDAEDYGVFNLKKSAKGYINLPMTSFLFFASGSSISDPPLGDYSGTKQWYNMLNGYTPTDDLANPTPYTIGSGPGVGEPTKFPLSGDPFAGTGDLDGTGVNLPPGDRRIGMASGPFTMAPGDTQEVVVAVVGGIVNDPAGDNRNAVAQLKLNDRYAQFLYDNLFEDVPKPPAQPSVNAVELDDAVVLEWGSNPSAFELTEAPGSLGFEFEGYNVYQLPSANASKEQAKLIATYDLNNGIQIIRGQKFVPSFGDILTVPLQKGTDSGIKRNITIDRDYINDKPLYAGNTYYFAVTAYNYNPDPAVPEPSLESSLAAIVVVPQGAKPGEKINAQPEDALTVSKEATSTGDVSAIVVNPKALTGHSYKVTFNDEKQFVLGDAHTDSLGNITGYDTLGIWYKWNLLDVTAGDTLLKDQTNLSGDDSYTITDGVMVKVEGSKTFGYAGWDYSGNRWISGVDWGGRGLFGGLDAGYNFFGSTLGDPDLKPVQLVFQDQADVDANGYISEGPVYRRDKSYAFEAIGKIPFAAYDVTDPANPRRLNIAFVEMDGQDGAPANNIWDMGWNGTEFPGDIGAREYIFIMNSDYNGGVDYDDTNFAPAADVLYAIWPKNRGSRGYLLAEFTLDIIANIPNGPSDTFSFSTESYISNDAALAAADVENINVFPNPYYAFNPEETSRFSRFVTFNHLPEKATIRIFNLAGVQVRKLEKDDPSQFFRWDLRNQSDLPVASGMYVAHIDMPDLGKTKVVKVFIVQSQEVLKYY